jgi:glycosyltransferase involved in cell wall biosynthesis
MGSQQRNEGYFLIRYFFVEKHDVMQNHKFPPLVSVVIPCYNYARFLPDAVASVQEQTHTNWECIIINDGSTDDTAAVAERLAGKDARIKVIHQENRGPSSARNRGLDVALGEYIQFLVPMISSTLAKSSFNSICWPARETRVGLQRYRYCDRDNPDITVSRDTLAPPRFKTRRPILDLASRWKRNSVCPSTVSCSIPLFQRAWDSF